MPCCEPSLGLAYLRRLLARRPDIAVHPRDALDFDQPPPTVYFYRPGEILVPDDQAPVFLAAAAQLKLRYMPIVDDGSGQKGRYPDPESDAESRPGSESDSDSISNNRVLRRFAVLSSEELDTVLARLERVAGGGLRISPNHVMFGCPEWLFDPATEPEPVDPAGLARPADSEDPPVLVAVLDSGLPRNFFENELLAEVPSPHPDELEPWDYQGGSHVLQFPQGHGSAVTGLVSQSSARAEVASYMALDSDGVTDEWFLGTQLAVALRRGPAVINLSLGTYTRGDEEPLGLEALRVESGDGSSPVVIAAAGNNGDDRPFYPAANSWVIGVGAVRLIDDYDGPAVPVKAWFSNWGPWVDVWAPGVDIHTAFEAHPYQPETDPAAVRFFHGAARWSGTSFAAPTVTGRVADLLAVLPDLGRAGVLSELQDVAPTTLVPDTFGDGTYVPWPP